MIVNYGKNQISYLIAGSTTIIPSHFMIGSGSGVALATQTALIAVEDRQSSLSSSPSLYHTRFTGDWTSTEMSGLTLSEIAICTSGEGLTGSIWSRTSLTPIIFDGTNELRIEENWEIY